MKFPGTFIPLLQASGSEGANARAKRIFFFIADITGYTKFVAETELEHANGIVEALFDVILPMIRDPLAVANLQGDAVFAYALNSDLAEGQFLLDLADRVYCAFAETREKMEINTSGDCRACRAIGDLELKIILHYGQCATRDVGGAIELTGLDVITAFRLLKNKVQETTGLKAYTILTCDAVQQMALGEAFETSERHTETFEHVGDVEYVLVDLQKVYSRKRGRERIYVSPDASLCFGEWTQHLKAPPEVVFTMCTRRDLRGYWMGSDAVDLLSSSKGRIEEGSRYHCHHGKDSFEMEFVDWRTGEYVTSLYHLPMGITAHETMEMEETDDGTLYRLRMEYMYAKNPLVRMLMCGMVNKKVAATHAMTKDERLKRLKQRSEELAQKPVDELRSGFKVSEKAA